MSDLDPVCIHSVVRSICPWKDCNPNFAEEPDYRNLPEDVRSDGEAQDSRGEVGPDRAGAPLDQSEIGEFVQLKPGLADSPPSGPELESPRDCIGACGYQSRCYAHRDGIEWERRRIVAWARTAFASQGFQNHGTDYKDGYVTGWFALLRAIEKGAHSE